MFTSIYFCLYMYCKTLLPTKIKFDPKSKSKWTHQARMHYTHAHKWVASTLYLFITYFLKNCVCVCVCVLGSIFDFQCNYEIDEVKSPLIKI
jgi:hypothetical protein